MSMTLHEILYGTAPLRQLSLAELSRLSPLLLIVEGDDVPNPPAGTRLLRVGEDLRDPEGRLTRALRSVRPEGPYALEDGRIMS